MRVVRAAIGALIATIALVGAATAQTARFDRTVASLEAITCPSGPPDSSADMILTLLSAYGDAPVEAQANAAKVTLKDFVLGGGSISRAAEGPAYVERILSANPDAYDGLIASLKRDGSRLCPVLEVIGRKGLKGTVDAQENHRAYYRPHAALAQAALNLHGCDAGLADGLFGSGSRAAWARADMPDPGETGVPTPADTAALWHGLDQGMRCTRARSDLRALRLALETCLSGRSGGTSTARLGWAIADAAGQDPAAVTPLLGGLWSLCRGQLMRQETNGYGLSGRLLLRSTLAALPEITGEDAAVLANGLRAATDPEAAAGELGQALPREPLDIPALLTDLASALFLGDDGMPQSRDLAANLLLEMKAADSYGPGPGPGLLAAIRSGVLTEGISAETLARARAASNEDGRTADRALPEDPVARVQDILENGAQWSASIFGAPYDGAPILTAGGAALDFGTDIGGINLGVTLADAVQESARASAYLLAQGGAAANTGVAVLLSEGNTGAGPDHDLALAHFRAAAEMGNGYALFRLGLAAETGLGGAVDLAQAEAFHRRAAKAGQPAAAMRLGDLAIRGRIEAADGEVLGWLRQGIGLDQTHLVKGAETPLLALIRHYPDAAQSGPLADVLSELARVSKELNADNSYLNANLALSIGDGFAGRVPGAVLDPAQAAFWYRRAGRDGRARLVRLLAARPDLAARPGELADLADTSLFALYAVSPTPQAFQSVLAERCPPAASGFDCVEFMGEAALGALPSASGNVEAGGLLKIAHDWLVEAAAAERAALLSPATEPTGLWDGQPRRTEASWALARVLGFYGDHAEARAVLRPLPVFNSGANGGPGDVMVEITDAAFRRAAARFAEGGDRPRWRPVELLLQDLAQRGDKMADALLELARAEAASPVAPRAIDEVRAQFALIETLYPARGMSAAARRLSTLEADAGNRLRAAELEMRAFGADLERHAGNALRLGTLHATMGRVCSYSRSSERMFALDQPQVALVLAKQAVNDLQSMRARLRGLPEKLQMCFRDSVAEHYRWLADLFIAQDRPTEATRVLQMLKSFETFEFLERDEDYRGISLDQLPLTAGEAAILKELEQAAPITVTALGLERRALLLARRDGTLSTDQAARLDELNTLLAAEREAREETLQEIALRAEEADRLARIDALEDSKSVKALLRRAYGGKAVALHFVVLPGSMGAVLTTPVSERVFTWDSIGDQPFSEALLNDRIDSLRAALRDTSVDPRALSREMLDLVLPPELRAEIVDAGAEVLIVSPDRRLRYLPFAALHDGDRFLVEWLDIVHVTEAPNGGGGAVATEMAAFGTTRGWHGFAPLPGVKSELEALMGDAGLFSGRPRLDGEFTRDRLASSLVFDDGAGIVHLASHFKLAETENTSFLLLGDGGQLSIRDIKEGFGIDLDFTEVSLLTMSACETGFGGPGADGRELESFAAVAQEQGASVVVATLWPVADTSTAKFMRLFYGALARDGAAPRHALSAAQRAFLADASSTNAPEAARGGRGLKSLVPRNEDLGRKHPFYWAPFVALEGSV